MSETELNLNPSGPFLGKLIEYKLNKEIWIDYAITGTGVAKGDTAHLLIAGYQEKLEADYVHVKGEDFIQICFFDWLRKIASPIDPDFKFLHHVPNGGERTKREGAKMKRLGVKRGVADCFWPYVGPNEEAGLYIEFKDIGRQQSEFQKSFQKYCESQNYTYKLAYTPVEAIQHTLDYYNKELL